jgi:hypothetical protein
MLIGFKPREKEFRNFKGNFNRSQRRVCSTEPGGKRLGLNTGHQPCTGQQVLMPKTKRPQQKRKTKKRRRISDSQTNQPFEKDSKRRIGLYGGAGEPPLMKK